jgi:hypothetical protein
MNGSVIGAREKAAELLLRIVLKTGEQISPL